MDNEFRCTDCDMTFGYGQMRTHVMNTEHTADYNR